MKIPYNRPWLGEPEYGEVLDTLRSGWLTAGKKVVAFEEKFSRYKGGAPAVALDSCTSGLFLALRSLDLQPGEEVITTPFSFPATANVIVHNGAVPVFADIDPATLNLDPEQVARRVTSRTRAILPVHVGGIPCQMSQLMEIAGKHSLAVIEDCAHAIEGEFQGKPLGTFGHAGAFSFYPTKNITAAEGGMLTCKDTALEKLIRLLSRHGLDSSTLDRDRDEELPLYDVVLPGYKCNMTDLQAAIGLHQMDRIPEFYRRRQVIKERYDETFAGLDTVRLLQPYPGSKPALHLYQLVLQLDTLNCSRNEFIRLLRDQGIQLSVNFTPIHLFSWYQKSFGYQPQDFPQALACGKAVISLPFYPGLTDAEIEYVQQCILTTLSEKRR